VTNGPWGYCEQQSLTWSSGLSNHAIDRAWAYHNHTKHSCESVRRSAHFLDWANQPLLFKIYPNLDPIALPRETMPTGVPALEAARAAFPAAPPRRPVAGLAELSHLFYFTAGITKKRAYPGGEILFRAAACTGALYEIELYVVCGSLPDLAAGVYHFGPADLALRRLREGDFRGAVAAATDNEPRVAEAPVIVITTGTYWRNAWKYGARTYRHFGWDNGTLHANLLAMAAALGYEARLRCGFVDAEVNRLLALDTDREVALTLVALGSGMPAPPPVHAPPVSFETVPLSGEEVDYPEMRAMHEASSLATPEEVREWRQGAARREAASLAPLGGEQIPRDSIEDVILRRGSTRRFRRDAITLAQLSTILERSTAGLAADFHTRSERLNELYLIVHAVEGLEPGIYHYGSEGGIERLNRGEFRQQAAHLALDQDLAGDAAVAVFFLADLNRVLEGFGNRGYRAVQLEAGILGGRMYLAAYAQRLGATGLTFYDDDVVQFFSPHAAGKSAILLVAVGHPARRQQ
jgi:SagB-type dehydrogenase family enzyme